MLKAIIFDMDGVLVDSTEISWKSFIQFFAKYGVDINTSDKKRYLGRALSDQLKMWKEEFHIQEDIPLEILREASLKYQFANIKKDFKPDSFVQKLIYDAKNKGIKIAVATSSSKKRAIILLEAVEIYDKIDALITCDDVEKSKPDPAIFLKAAEALSLPPSECIVIEDALNGVQAAQAAGMKTAGRIGESHTRKEFGMTDLVFENFSEIHISDLEEIFEYHRE